MPELSSLAYSLSQNEEGWRWSVYDEDGVTVGDGAHPDQAQAQAAVERLICCAAESQRSPA